MKKFLFILMTAVISSVVIGCANDSSSSSQPTTTTLQTGTSTIETIQSYLPAGYPDISSGTGITGNIEYSVKLNLANEKELYLYIPNITETQINNLKNILQNYYGLYFVDAINVWKGYQNNSPKHEVSIILENNGITIVFKIQEGDINIPNQDEDNTNPDTPDTDVEGVGMRITTLKDFLSNFISSSIPNTSIDNKNIFINENEPIIYEEFSINYKTTSVYAKGDKQLKDYEYNITIGEPDTGVPVNIRNYLLQTDSFSEEDRIILFNALQESNYYSESNTKCGWRQVYNQYMCEFVGINNVEQTESRFMIQTNETVPYRNYKNILHTDKYKYSIFSAEHRQYFEPQFLPDDTMEDLNNDLPDNYPDDWNDGAIKLYLPSDYPESLSNFFVSFSRTATDYHGHVFDNTNPDLPVLTLKNTMFQNNSDTEKLENKLNEIFTEIENTNYYTNINKSLSDKKLNAESTDHNLAVYVDDNNIINIQFDFKYDISTAPAIN